MALDPRVYDIADEIKERCFTEELSNIEWESLILGVGMIIDSPEVKKYETQEEPDLQPVWDLLVKTGFAIPPIYQD